MTLGEFARKVEEACDAALLYLCDTDQDLLAAAVETIEDLGAEARLLAIAEDLKPKESADVE